MLGAIPGCQVPVSYTHLDVYKRQEEHKVGGGPDYRCHRAVSSSRRTDGVRYPAFGAMDYLGRRQAVT